MHVELRFCSCPHQCRFASVVRSSGFRLGPTSQSSIFTRDITLTKMRITEGSVEFEHIMQTKSAVTLSKRHHGKLPYAWCSRRQWLVSSRPDRTRLRQQQLLLSQISWHCNPRSSLKHNSEGPVKAIINKEHLATLNYARGLSAQAPSKNPAYPPKHRQRTRP